MWLPYLSMTIGWSTAGDIMGSGRIVDPSTRRAVNSEGPIDKSTS